MVSNDDYQNDRYILAVDVTAKKFSGMGMAIHNVIVKPVVLTAYLNPISAIRRKKDNSL